jgi:hypothetical protein
MFVDIYTVMVDCMEDLFAAQSFIIWSSLVLAAVGAAAYWAFLRYADAILFYGLK